MQQRVFDLLWDHALDNPINSQSKHAAAIVSRDGLFIVGTNRRKTHPLQQRFAKNKHAIELHAEIDVLVRALRQLDVVDLSESSLFVARVKNHEISKKKMIKMWGNSEPCDGCYRAIEAFGLKSVYYTLDSPKDQLMVEEWHRA